MLQKIRYMGPHCEAPTPEYPSLMQPWDVCQIRNSGMSISPATLESKCQSDPCQWNVCQFRKSVMPIRSITLKCPSFLQLWNVCQSCNSGMSILPATQESVSLATLEWLSVKKVSYIMARRINVLPVVLVPVFTALTVFSTLFFALLP